MLAKMGHCGAPTFICVFLLLFMGALYVKASRNEPTYSSPRFSPERLAVARSLIANMDFGSSSRGRQGRIADSSRPTTDGRNRRVGGGGGRRGSGSRRNRTGSRMGRRTVKRTRRLGNATTPFATRLMGELYPDLRYNTVFSPHSIHAAMSMVLLGARGRTERQIYNALGLRQVRLRGARVHRAYQTLLTSLRRTHRDVHVLSANAVFVKPNIPLELNFRRQLEVMYLAKFDSFNMSHPLGPEADINDWVSDQTRGKIQDLLAPDSIDNNTAMVLVNAVYLNASWAQPFNRQLTQEGTFHSFSTGNKRLEMMETTGVYRYANHQNIEVVELPYKGDRLSMYILLPHDTSDIQELLQQLGVREDAATVSPLERLLQDVEPTFMKISLPKFRIESGALDVKQSLRDLGITKAFQSHRANFTGISVVDLYIDETFHKAVIEVNEDGTTAAAATAVYFGIRSSLGESHQVMNINRPFVFVVRDKTMNAVLFIGSFLGQTEAEVQGS